VDRDRRRHRRFDVKLDVELETAETHAVVAGRSVNVSEGGVMLQAGQPVEAGALVYLVLGTTDRTLATLGQVVSSSSDVSSSSGQESDLLDVRVRFLEMSDRKRVGLDRMLHESLA
jgi:c-di-GMP-binding flagellar brake protein YcgR